MGTPVWLYFDTCIRALSSDTQFFMVGFAIYRAVTREVGASNRRFPERVEQVFAAFQTEFVEQVTNVKFRCTFYVLRGGGQVRWGRYGEFSEMLRPGDFVFVPAGLPRQELNPSTEAVIWVVVRSGAQPVVVNLSGFDSVVSTSAH